MQKILSKNSFLFTSPTAKEGVFDYSILDERSGMIVAEILGDEAEVAFSNESGGHRWQRIPPNEKRGRRHTSTVTVAVFPIIPPQDWEFSEGEIEWEAILGTGPGGQARNKTANVIRAT